MDQFSWEERDTMPQKWDTEKDCITGREGTPYIVHYYRIIFLSLKLEPKSVRAPRTDVLLEGKVVFVQPES